MNKFTRVSDVEDVSALIKEAIQLKADPFLSDIGSRKTLAMIFLNPSLRTRMSTQKAAQNLGMNTIVMNMGKDGWALEFEDGAVMDGSTVEHIKDAAQVISQYCDVLAIRSFAKFEDRDEDYNEQVLSQLIEHASVPVVSMESATRHPLQSLADLVTIAETGIQKPKVAVTWAPHPKPLPHAVVNSFLEWIQTTDADVTLTHPEGYELDEEFSGGVKVTYDQEKAFEDADFVYTKSWASYTQYGKRPPVEDNWTVTVEKMKRTNNGRFMHCLPVRRNVVAEDAVIDNSIVYEQARNRVCSCQAVLKNILEAN
ncbi:N-acetylornithine carbamoyltransferase [Aliifodinibius sp. S!AR15-10]|uniref:N-acetylornithine carbamoyltransferase n=1 Tax=Aliifodinibius sp. S!AR15-10 TaxID=2950437 RepID=UPI002855451C|nr:N-acetylornithine carbamoyltransferase [Aliifodinibius sp. S!AR15-10]MDR8392184.1 N-acetylornithine carbamoyltransferase [Aliifodinibius sp. S!AR15-10]